MAFRRDHFFLWQYTKVPHFRRIHDGEKLDPVMGGFFALSFSYDWNPNGSTTWFLKVFLSDWPHSVYIFTSRCNRFTIRPCNVAKTFPNITKHETAENFEKQIKKSSYGRYQSEQPLENYTSLADIKLNFANLGN